MFSLASLFGWNTLGVEFTESVVRIGRGVLAGDDVKMSVKGEADIPKGEGGDPAKLGDLLHALCTRHHVRPGQTVLLLPPSAVYTALLHLPQGGRFDEEVRKCMPEELSALLIQREDLGEGTVGVAAMRQDRLEMYRRACMGAGMRIGAITTAPCALAAFAQRKEGRDAARIVVRAFPGSEPTITLFHRGWPVDEVLLPLEASSSEIAALVRDLLIEYETRGLFIVERIAVHGKGVSPAEIGAALPPISGMGAAEGGGEKRERQVLPLLGEAGVYGGVCCAALHSCVTHLDLLRAQPLRV